MCIRSTDDDEAVNLNTGADADVKTGAANAAADSSADADADADSNTDADTAESQETVSLSRASDAKTPIEPLNAMRTERVVRDLFGKFGVVRSVTVLKPKPGKVGLCTGPALTLVACDPCRIHGRSASPCQCPSPFPALVPFGSTPARVVVVHLPRSPASVLAFALTLTKTISRSW